MEGKLLVGPAGCLDTKPEKRSDAHIFISYKASWEEALERINKFDCLPE
jgi:hypothetical protein